MSSEERRKGSPAQAGGFSLAQTTPFRALGPQRLGKPRRLGAATILVHLVAFRVTEVI